MVEVVLDRAELPRATDRVADVDVDLRSVERGVTFFDLVRQAVLDERGAERLGRRLPDRVVADVLVGILRRQVGGEVVEAERAQHAHHEVEQRRDLVLRLILRAEDVAVVLREAADAHQAVQRAGPFVAVDRAELVEPQRQLAIAALAAAEDQAVHRAVHRLHVVRAVVHLHRRVHAVLVEVEMARRLEQLAVGEVRREDELVAAGDVTLAAVVLHQLADDRTLRMPDRQTAAELVREAQQIELGRRACGGRASRLPPGDAGARRAPPCSPTPCRRCAAASGPSRCRASRRRRPSSA